MEEYIFTSQRLGFRKWSEADIEPFAAINADPDVMKYFPNILTLEETSVFVDRIHASFSKYNYCFYAVDILKSQEFIGFIGFMWQTFEANFTPCAEIGWRLKKQVWNQGLATEGATRCLQYGFNELNFKEVYSFTATINKPSERIMQKISMQKIGEFDHPKLAKEDVLCRHVLYKIARKP